MNLKLSGIEHIIDCGNSAYINSVVIESPRLLCEVLMDLECQIQGDDGKSVVSENDKVLPTAKCLEVHTRFVPFELNQKNLINKATAKLIEIALDEENYMQSSELVGDLERYLMNLSIGLTGSIDTSKVSIENLIKNSGLTFVDDYSLLSEKLLDYFELVREYDQDKIFVLLNLRSFLSTNELQQFVDEILLRRFQVVLIESTEYSLLDKEKRLLIDDSLCEIC